MSRAPSRGRYDRAVPAAERRAQQRLLLIEAAAHAIATRGFPRTTVAHVLARARMSRRTFYEHFGDLRDALLAIYDYGASQGFSVVSTAIAATSDPLDKIKTGIDAYLAAVAANPEMARVIFLEIRAAGPDVEARRQLETGRYAALLFEAASAAHARGLFSRPPDELTTFALTSAMEGVVVRYLYRREEVRLPLAAPALLELVLRAFR